MSNAVSPSNAASHYQLRSARFRAEREADWERLETILKRAERGGPGNLNSTEMMELPKLYRAAISALSVARASSLDKSLETYLEALCARAYFFVYGARTTFLERLTRFFLEDWPKAVQASGWAIAFSALCLFGGAFIAFIMFMQDPETFWLFRSGGFDLRTPEASTHYLRSTLYHEPGDVDVNTMLTSFASQLFTHNAGIAIFAFALGIAFGIPTAALIAMNGLYIGSFYALFWSRGLGDEVTGWLLIHGVTELWAVVLAGAAGFVVAVSVAFPGDRSRLAAARHAGERATTLIMGAVVMLFAAALLEGFGRESINSDIARYSIAGGTAILWALYFYIPRRHSN